MRWLWLPVAVIILIVAGRFYGGIYRRHPISEAEIADISLDYSKRMFWIDLLTKELLGGLVISLVFLNIILILLFAALFVWRLLIELRLARRYCQQRAITTGQDATVPILAGTFVLMPPIQSPFLAIGIWLAMMLAG